MSRQFGRSLRSWLPPGIQISLLSGQKRSGGAKSGQNALYYLSSDTCGSSANHPWQSIMDQTEWRVRTTSGGTMNQLALIPLDGLDSPLSERSGSRLVRMPGRQGRAPRIAVGAPGFLSVRAAAERLDLKPR